MSTKQENSYNDTRMRWYLDSKFGMFIHWGAYTVAGAEASWPIMAPGLSEAMFVTPSNITEAEYVGLPEKFDPVGFDADEWVKTAQNAGMRYMVITAKHHDGFCMFDAPGTDYKITNTPFARDVCKELADACARHNMKLGFYYSPPDMHHPGYRDISKPSTQNWLGEPNRPEWGSYLDYMESHIRKLLTDYGDVCLLWFDGLCYHDKYDPERFHKLIHELSPETLINDRLGNGYDFVTPEQFIPKEGVPIKTGKPSSGASLETEKFFRTVVTLFKIPLIRGWIKKQMRKYSDGTMELTPVTQERYPEPERFQPWETCMTIGQSWAYNPNEEKWKSSEELIRNLAKVASRGGNYLLNVCPTDRGVFPEQAVRCLSEIGQWMEKNSEAIYSTTYTPLQEAEWGCATRKGSRIYLLVYKEHARDELSIADFPGRVESVSLLDGTALSFELKDGALNIEMPETVPDEDVVTVCVDVSDVTELDKYLEPELHGKRKRKYITDSMKVSALINGMANGLIALFSYMKAGPVAAADAGIDALITVGIITLLTSWLVVGGTRKDAAAGKIAGYEVIPDAHKPMPSGIQALLVMIFCVLALGGALNGLIYLVFPNGFSNWGYIVFKTLYTAASGALGVLATIVSVLWEKGIKKIV